MEKKTGIIKVVAKTGGIKFAGEEEWYNPTSKAKSFIKQEMKGKTCTLTLTDKEREFSFIGFATNQQESKSNESKPAQLDKDGYWRNKEIRDIQNAERITRHGALNTALEAIKISANGKEIDLKSKEILQLAVKLSNEIIVPYTTEKRG